MIATTRAALHYKTTERRHLLPLSRSDPMADLNQETSIEDDLFPQQVSGLPEARVTVRAR
jgi:hypothetical protein